MPLKSRSSACIALIPAAGTGQRMGGHMPKQYQPIGEYPMLVHTIRSLQHPAIQHRYVVLAPGDTWFEQFCMPHIHHETCTPLYVGSTTRAASVLAGLSALPPHHQENWVFVHDAARPCLHIKDLERLLETALRSKTSEKQGYVLGHPVADTLKRTVADSHTSNQVAVQETIARDALWQAQTPQVAHVATLKQALESAALHHPDHRPTDEAQALEWSGYPVDLIAAHYPNFKVTYPSDQRLAELLLTR